MTPHVSITLLRTQTDERLIELIAAGHDRAFDAIVDRYRRPLLRYARRFLHEDTRAEDVVQSAFVSAWTALSDGVTVRDLRPWLYRIVHNGALNVMKKPGSDDAVLIEASDLRPGPATEVEQREDVRQALDTIASLPERQRTALLAVAFDGRSHADVGAELGLKEPAVRQLVSRARTSLRVAATAITPWPAAAWLAGVGGAQAGDTAARVGEVVGGVGAGTVFGGGALKAGALVAAAGAVAVGAPKMAEVAHHHASRSVATASAASANRASSSHAATTADGSGHAAGGAAPVLVSTSAGRPTLTPSTSGQKRAATSGGWRHSGRSTHSHLGATGTLQTGARSGGGSRGEHADSPVVSGEDTTSHGEHHRSASHRSSERHSSSGGDGEGDRSTSTAEDTSGTSGTGDTTESRSGDTWQRQRSTDSTSSSQDSGASREAQQVEQPEPQKTETPEDKPETSSTPVAVPSP